MQPINVQIALAPDRPLTIDDMIDWLNRDPRAGGLLRQHEAIITAQGPEVVAARVAEGKRFLGALPAVKALALCPL